MKAANEFGSYSIWRTGTANDLIDDLGSVEIIDDRGEKRDLVQLEGLLAGVDEPTYNNVFNVGLREIQELGSLDDTAAANYLYRLTSGLDRVSLIDVIREVQTARERLLATDEKASSQIPQLIARRKKLRDQIEDLSRKNPPLERPGHAAGELDRRSEATRQANRRHRNIVACPESSTRCRRRSGTSAPTFSGNWKSERSKTAARAVGGEARRDQPTPHQWAKTTEKALSQRRAAEKRRRFSL